MKKLLLSSVALLGLTVAAGAADLPRRAAPPVFAPVPVFTWTGFYVGVNAGYAWADRNRDDVFFIPAGTVVNAPLTAGTLTLFGGNGDDDGFTAGGTIGFNWQMGSIVVGVEGDLNWADIGRDGTLFVPGTYTFVGVTEIPATASIVTNGTGIDWFGTLRGRVGVAFDRALIYATGGFAFGGGGGNNCGGLLLGCDDDDWRGGWTVGGGLEYAFTNNLTAKVEGLYVNLGDNNNAATAVYSPAANTVFINNSRGDDTFGLIRVGVNYKFGS